MARTVTEDVFDLLNKDPEVSRTIKSSAMSTMRAIVLHEAGGPEVLTIEEKWPKPIPQPGQVLIKVKAFGLNRSEMFTRQ